jgi:hypothetical protein
LPAAKIESQPPGDSGTRIVARLGPELHSVDAALAETISYERGRGAGGEPATSFAVPNPISHLERAGARVGKQRPTSEKAAVGVIDESETPRRSLGAVGGVLIDARGEVLE